MYICSDWKTMAEISQKWNGNVFTSKLRKASAKEVDLGGMKS